MDSSIYINSLNNLCEAMDKIPNTILGAKLKMICLVTLNMQYEKIAFNKKLEKHPFLLVAELIDSQISNAKSFADIMFIENSEKSEINYNELILEEKHHDLWNAMWDKYSEVEYEKFISRCAMRFTANNLQNVIKNKKVLDIGCGNGATCIALLDLGAESVDGIDFGEKSIDYANKNKNIRKHSEKIRYQVGNAYSLPFANEEFDFVVAKGVFHHLTAEEKALEEVFRVIKKGGNFYYYVDGEGGISHNLWDYSVKILKNVPEIFIFNFLSELNVIINKKIHLTDGFKATYKHTSWNKLTEQLQKIGFEDFRRLIGGCDFDFDHDAIEADPYGKEKFGEGDLRILAKKL